MLRSYENDKESAEEPVAKKIDPQLGLMLEIFVHKPYSYKLLTNENADPGAAVSLLGFTLWVGPHRGPQGPQR